MITLHSSLSRITVPRLAQPVRANKINRLVKATAVKHLTFSFICIPFLNKLSMVTSRLSRSLPIDFMNALVEKWICLFTAIDLHNILWKLYFSASQNGRLYRTSKFGAQVQAYTFYLLRYLSNQIVYVHDFQNRHINYVYRCLSHHFPSDTFCWPVSH